MTCDCTCTEVVACGSGSGTDFDCFCGSGAGFDCNDPDSTCGETICVRGEAFATLSTPTALMRANVRGIFSWVGQNAMGLSRQERDATETCRLPVWRRGDGSLPPNAFRALGVFRGRRWSIRMFVDLLLYLVNMIFALSVNPSNSMIFAHKKAFFRIPFRPFSRSGILFHPVLLRHDLLHFLRYLGLLQRQRRGHWRWCLR